MGVPAIPFERIQPNRMQAEALRNLDEIRSKGKDRALVISATGSGKTYLSAFDAKVSSKKFLYIVYRLRILNKSMESFEKVMEGTKSVEKYDIVRNNLDADCIFTTIQVLAKDDVLNRIPKDLFDYILIDEVHHVGAPTYQKVLSHFEPSFLLGMTATPDRTDGFDIYKLFDYNIAYNVRLKEAMEYKLICPFHYFGISDLSFDGSNEDDLRKLSKISLDQRVDHIIDNAEYYGYCGDRVKGLVFCRDLYDAEIYSREFNRRGYHTAWVSGKMDRDYVASCIERLESDEGSHLLDYIFTADLFNEGVDIPAINQVIMLRPTQSPIIFIQQLGRGLRHYPGKDYVVILDFIGNYETTYTYSIPLALSDDRSYNKSEARRFVATGDSIIPGNSTISFDRISRNRIYQSIDTANFSESKILLEGYRNLKMKLGRIPRLTDFRRYGSIDALNILSKYHSYHGFLLKYEGEYESGLSKAESKTLSLITKIAASGKRCLEIEALDLLIHGTVDLISDLESYDEGAASSNILEVLDGSFYQNDICLIQFSNGRATCSTVFDSMLNNRLFSDHVNQVIELGRDNWAQLYSERYGSSFFCSQQEIHIRGRLQIAELAQEYQRSESRRLFPS